MNLDDVEALIESELEDADATVTHARDEHDDDHLAATVVSPAFEDSRWSNNIRRCTTPSTAT